MSTEVIAAPSTSVETAAPATATPATQTVATTSASFRDFIADGDTFKPGWAKAIGAPDTLEQKFTSPKSLVGSYASLEKMISAKGIIKPGADATPEQKAAFYDALGRPKAPADYGIKMPEKVGDKPYPKQFWDQKFADEAAKTFHDIGLTAEQAARIADLHNSRTIGAMGDAEAILAKSRTDGEAALRAEWGAKFDEQLALAEKGAAAAGLSADVLKAKPYLSNDPDYIRAMAKVGAMIGETPAAAARGTQGTNMDPQSEINAIMNDPKHPWQPSFQKNGHSAAAHMAAVQHMAKLFAMKNPG